MTDVNVYKELITEISQTATALVDELAAYGETVSNKAAAQRARKITGELDKLGKEFRKASVAFHKA